MHMLYLLIRLSIFLIWVYRFHVLNDLHPFESLHKSRIWLLSMVQVIASRRVEAPAHKALLLQKVYWIEKYEFSTGVIIYLWHISLEQIWATSMILWHIYVCIFFIYDKQYLRTVCVIIFTSEKQHFFLQLVQPANHQTNLDIPKDLQETLQLLD